MNQRQQHSRDCRDNRADIRNEVQCEGEESPQYREIESDHCSAASDQDAGREAHQRLDREILPGAHDDIAYPVENQVTAIAVYGVDFLREAPCLQQHEEHREQNQECVAKHPAKAGYQ